MGTFNIVVLPGDGIGPEVAAAGVSALKVIGEVYGHTFNFDEKRIGGIAIDTDNNPYPEDTDKACLRGRRRAARRRWRSEVGPGQDAPGAGPAGRAQVDGPVRQPASDGASRPRRSTARR